MSETTDYEAVMWSTLRVWANGDADSLEQEVMAWAASEIERLRARVAELESEAENLRRYPASWSDE